MPEPEEVVQNLSRPEMSTRPYSTEKVTTQTRPSPAFDSPSPQPARQSLRYLLPQRQSLEHKVELVLVGVGETGIALPRCNAQVKAAADTQDEAMDEWAVFARHEAIGNSCCAPARAAPTPFVRTRPGRRRA